MQFQLILTIVGSILFSLFLLALSLVVYIVVRPVKCRWSKPVYVAKKLSWTRYDCGAFAA